jgi:hypothetical protein
LEDKHLPKFKPELIPKRDGSRSISKNRYSMSIPATERLYDQAETKLLKKEQTRLA